MYIPDKMNKNENMLDSQMHVKKRDGSFQEVKFDKILARVKKMGIQAGVSINFSALVIKIIDQIYDCIPTTKIDELTAEQQQREHERRPRSRSPSPSSDNKKEAFAILGIQPTSSKTEIQKAYRRQALLLHPDKHIHNKEEATRRFQELQAAMDEINKEPHRGGRRHYRSYRKLKTRSNHHSHRRSRHTSRHHKRLRKSSKKYRLC